MNPRRNGLLRRGYWRGAEKTWHVFVRLQTLILATMLCGIVLVALANVFMRYALVDSISWADEIARLAFVVFSFLGAGLAVAFGAHLVIDVLPERTSPDSLLGRIWRWLIRAIALAFFVSLIWGGSTQAIAALAQASPALQIPMGYVYAAVPLGASLMVLNFTGSLLFGPHQLPGAEQASELHLDTPRRGTWA